MNANNDEDHQNKKQSTLTKVDDTGKFSKMIEPIEESRSKNIAFLLHDALNNTVSFSGDFEFYCVSIVDMVNSTNITSRLPYKKACMYYSIFLNTMSTVVNEFGATIVKNVGDSLLYYFPKTSDQNNKFAYREVLDCGLEMIKLRSIINDKMSENDLPELNFRISADYGQILMADSMTSFNKDIFGSPVNICAKINSMAIPNNMVVGGDLYQIVKNEQKYDFKEIEPYSIGLKNAYSVYNVRQKK